MLRRNPQATKSGPKRRRLHPEQRSRAILAIHLALALPQGALNVGTLHFPDLRDRQNWRCVILGAACRRLLWQPLLGLSEFELESSTSRADQGALDDVLQLADIARPIVTLEPLDVATSQFSRRKV